MKQRLLFVCAALLLAGAGCGPGAPPEEVVQFVDLTMPDGTVLNVELASTLDQQAKGLSGREDIGDGMLFCMDEMKEQNFWMLGMMVPIDMVWMRSGDIIDIAHNVPIREDDKITTRSSGAAVNGILELPAGQAEALGLQSADDLPDVREHCNQ